MPPLVSAAFAAAVRQRRENRQLRRMSQHRSPPERTTADALEDVQRNISSHRSPPMRKTQDQLRDVLADAVPAHRSPPQRTTHEGVEDVLGKAPLHRVAPKRRKSLDIDADLSLSRRSAQQYRPPPVRTVVTPGLPPLGAGSLQVSYRAPPPKTDAEKIWGAPASDTISSYRLPPSRSQSDDPDSPGIPVDSPAFSVDDSPGIPVDSPLTPDEQQAQIAERILRARRSRRMGASPSAATSADQYV